jgi:hypothetical protein
MTSKYSVKRGPAKRNVRIALAALLPVAAFGAWAVWLEPASLPIEVHQVALGDRTLTTNPTTIEPSHPSSRILQPQEAAQAIVEALRL